MHAAGALSSHTLFSTAFANCSFVLRKKPPIIWPWFNWPAPLLSGVNSSRFIVNFGIGSYCTLSGVIVQPTHLLYGYEYDKLKVEAEALGGKFESLVVGCPLLANNSDIQRFAHRLAQDHPAETGTATVFMGHGTEHFANAAYPALQTALALLGRDDIYIGTVEGWPGLEDILRQLDPGGVREIRLLPLMLVAGDHAQNDMAGAWKTRLEQAGYTVGCSFTVPGELPWVQEMYRERLEELF